MEVNAIKERIERAFYSVTLVTICCAKWSGKAKVHSLGATCFCIEGYHRPIEITYSEVWFAGDAR